MQPREDVDVIRKIQAADREGSRDVQGTEKADSGSDRRAHDFLEAVPIGIRLDHCHQACWRDLLRYRRQIAAIGVQIDDCLSGRWCGRHALLLGSRAPRFAATSLGRFPRVSDQSLTDGSPSAGSPKTTATSSTAAWSSPMSTTRAFMATRPTMGRLAPRSNRPQTLPAWRSIPSAYPIATNARLVAFGARKV